MSQGFYENYTDHNYYFNFHLAKDDFMPAHYHGSTEILFVRTGKVKVICNGKERVLEKSEIAFFNRYDVHYICGEKESEIYVLVFSEAFYPKEEREKLLENFLSVGTSTEQIFRLLDYFYKFREDATQTMQAGFTQLLLGILYKNYPAFSKSSAEADCYAGILTYIDKNYAEPLTLDSIAAKFGYTKHYFSMLFNKFTGMHLRDYINRLRVEKVEEYKKEHPTEAIGAIALSCGFNSLNTYYRAVKNTDKR